MTRLIGENAVSLELQDRVKRFAADVEAVVKKHCRAPFFHGRQRRWFEQSAL
jgi:hypothetical protein